MSGNNLGSAIASAFSDDIASVKLTAKSPALLDGLNLRCNATHEIHPSNQGTLHPLEVQQILGCPVATLLQKRENAWAQGAYPTQRPALGMVVRHMEFATDCERPWADIESPGLQMRLSSV